MRAVSVLGPKRLFLLPFALFYVGGLLLLSRIIRVNIHPIVNSRIGHFATNTELSILKIKEREIRTEKLEINIFCATSDESCNSSLEKMWSRTFNLQTGNWSWLLKTTDFYQESTNLDREGRLLSFPPTLTFDDNELALGEKFLADSRISEPEKIVCLNVRDSSFFSMSKRLGWSKSRDWSYHDYRDSEISTYVDAAETLAEMGYTVFRMGAIVKEPIISKHPRVIDYATNGMRTEFLDIFLGSHCSFCVSTGTGWDSFPQIFRRPSLYVNLVPILAPACIVRDLLIYPKVHHDNSTKKDSGLAEIIDLNIHNAFMTADYAKAEISLRNMSSEELVEAVTEMARRVEGTFVETPEQKLMQEKLKHLLSTHPTLQPTPNYYPVRAKFASCFLSNNRNFLD